MKKFVLMGLILISGHCLANDYEPMIGNSGAGIFANACVTCHGAEGKGAFDSFFKLTDSTLPIEAIKTTIQHGGTLMPAFVKIKGKELDVLATYVRSLGVPATSK